jgi:hypothetical protein
VDTPGKPSSYIIFLSFYISKRVGLTKKAAKAVFYSLKGIICGKIAGNDLEKG